MDNSMRLPNEKIEGKYIGSVKVGLKGQIVIPKEVRDLSKFSDEAFGKNKD